MGQGVIQAKEETRSLRLCMYPPAWLWSPSRFLAFRDTTSVATTAVQAPESWPSVPYPTTAPRANSRWERVQQAGCAHREVLVLGKGVAGRTPGAVENQDPQC